MKGMGSYLQKKVSWFFSPLSSVRYTVENQIQMWDRIRTGSVLHNVKLVEFGTGENTIVRMRGENMRVVLDSTMPLGKHGLSLSIYTDDSHTPMTLHL